MNQLERLGRDVALAQDEERAGRELGEQAAQRFVRALRKPAPRTRARFLLLAAAFGVFVSLTAVWSYRRSERSAVATAKVGQALVAANDQSRPLSFPDGSGAVLGMGAEVRITELNATGARVEVSSGEVSFAVRHRPRTHWLVGAGPFRVHVTGTRFVVAWSPERDRFSLRLTEGSVVVSIETASHDDVALVAPASLLVEQGSWQVSTPTAVVSALPPETPPLAPPVPSTAPALDSASVEARGAALPPARVAKTWEELSRSGDYAAAHEAASRRGIAQLTETAPSYSLLNLAEVCRFTGHAVEVAQILTRLRQRFPGSDDAATAAFELGRHGGGASWFRTYLDERPNGALALEASGRLLEALARSNDRAGARDAANAYLSRYPNGPHAAFARQLLGP